MSKKSSKISKDEENALNWRPTSEEKELIRTTWSDDFEFLYKLGTKIYSYNFSYSKKIAINCLKLDAFFENYVKR